MEEQKDQAGQKHTLHLTEREELAIDGVVNVESFDEREVVLETGLGMLVVRGTGLRIDQLSIGSSKLVVLGVIKGLEYSGDGMGSSGKGLLARLFG